MKLAFISTHPAPYRDPFLKALSHRTDIKADIYSQFRKDTGHPFWNLSDPPYPMTIIAYRDGSTIAAFLRTLRWFVFGDYDVVCWNGYLPYWYMLLPMFLSAVFRHCYGIYADSVDERASSGVKHWIKKFIVKRASFFFVPGKATENFFVDRYGVTPKKICHGAYALDGLSLEKEILDLRANKTKLRQKYGFGEKEKIFLMVANMIPSRFYPVTASAFAEVASRKKGIRYVMVGKGPDLEAMEEMSKANSQITVIPGCSFEEMKGLYALSDVYVHGGKEPASTALVIGAIAHLPLITSRAVGCCIDCLNDGISGLEVKDYKSEKEWISTFERMIDMESSWSNMGAKAREFSRCLDVDVVIEKFCELVHKLPIKK